MADSPNGDHSVFFGMHHLSLVRVPFAIRY
jgi:hypothetical protein